MINKFISFIVVATLLSCTEDTSNVVITHTPEELFIETIRIISIPNENSQGNSWESDGSAIDPYVRISFQDGRVFRSDTIQNFNFIEHRFTFDSPIHFDKEIDKITVTLYDHDPGPLNSQGIIDDDRVGTFIWFPWSSQFDNNQLSEILLTGERSDRKIAIQYRSG